MIDKILSFLSNEKIFKKIDKIVKVVIGIVVFINSVLAAAEGFEKAMNSVKLFMKSNIDEKKDNESTDKEDKLNLDPDNL
jgi:hypothetical protein